MDSGFSLENEVILSNHSGVYPENFKVVASMDQTLTAGVGACLCWYCKSYSFY